MSTISHSVPNRVLVLAALVFAGIEALGVWPLPTNISQGNSSTAIFSPDFYIGCSQCPLTAGWYRDRIRASAATINGSTQPHDSVLHSVSVTVRTPLTKLGPALNESYVLSCNSAGSCELTAETFVGALRGLETLAHIAHVGWLQLPLQVLDRPQYSYRGLLIDSARHYLPAATVEKVIDFMSITKLNVLHWHLTDTTSFPVQSEKFPELSAKGALHPLAVYSYSDIRQLVEYARDRGVRVVPEFDMPGHSSWGKGRPDLAIPACGGVLDPTQDATYDFLKEFLTEMAAVFPDEYLALGGDEVSYDCAASVKKDWLAAHNMSAAELLPYFWKRMTKDVLPSLPDKTLTIWGTADLSNLDPSILPPGSVFNMYTGLDATLETTARKGVPGVLSAPYYLDQTMYVITNHLYYQFLLFPGRTRYVATRSTGRGCCCCCCRHSHYNDTCVCVCRTGRDGSLPLLNVEQQPATWTRSGNASTLRLPLMG